VGLDAAGPAVSATLSVRALGKRYGDLQALQAVTFDAEAGELVAVVGPNGAGKTTLLSIVAGVIDATEGSVEPSPHFVGWAPQQAALYSRLSVAENLELFARLEGAPEPRAAVARMLAHTGLAERARERVGRLSGGNRQRVNVALGLIGEPRVLALDEPSASLDPAQRERLWGLVAGLVGGGRTVLFSTHNVAEAQRYASRVIVLADGRLVFDGPPAVLLREGGQPANGDLERALVDYLRAPGRDRSEATARAPAQAGAAESR
jgi:ABC-2 type transport system ATP-binding protein